MAKLLKEEPMFEPDNRTVIGALPIYISTADEKSFQPMNANFGIVQGLDERIKKKADRYAKIAERALQILDKQLI